MEIPARVTVTGTHGSYQWLATSHHDLDSFLRLCPHALDGKYVAITSIDSGPLALSEEQKRAGWRSRGDVAYSPQVSSASVIPHSGFDEWYVFNTPTEIGTVQRVNVFEIPPSPEFIAVFVNFGDFAPHDAVEALTTLFWNQLDRLQPEAYIADGNQFHR